MHHNTKLYNTNVEETTRHSAEQIVVVRDFIWTMILVGGMVSLLEQLFDTRDRVNKYIGCACRKFILFWAPSYLGEESYGNWTFPMSANICYAELVLTHYQPWQICIGEDFEYQGKSNKLWDWSSCRGIGYGVEMDCYNGIKSDNCWRSYSESRQCHMLSRSPCLSSFGN